MRAQEMRNAGSYLRSCCPERWAQLPWLLLGARTCWERNANMGGAEPQSTAVVFIHTPLPVSHVPVHQAQRGAYQASQPGVTTELGFAGPAQAGSPKDFTLTLGEKLRFIPRIQTS